MEKNKMTDEERLFREVERRTGRSLKGIAVDEEFQKEALETADKWIQSWLENPPFDDTDLFRGEMRSKAPHRFIKKE